VCECMCVCVYVRVCVRERERGGVCVLVKSYVYIVVQTVLRIIKPVRMFRFVVFVTHSDPLLVSFQCLLILFGL
jgi:hypothetical protein